MIAFCAGVAVGVVAALVLMAWSISAKIKSVMKERPDV